MAITNENKRILVAMSGGVDSSAVAVLLKEQGYDVVGANMLLCGTGGDEDARKVAEALDIPFYVFDLRKEFSENIISKFVNQYKEGLTPNPCVDCNRQIKFGLLWEKAKELGCTHIATGHYAKVEFEEDAPVLKKAEFNTKDQSYFLHVIPADTLAHVIFPLGYVKDKDETRGIVREAGLDIASKGESQDICFVPDGDYVKVIDEFEQNECKDNKKSGFIPGDFVDPDGNKIGTHRGMIHYTIGQRRGIQVSSTEGRIYVTGKDVENNTVTLGPNETLFRTELQANNINWQAPGELPQEFRCSAKIRYRHQEQPCTVRIDPDEPTAATVVFDEAQRAITPGQAVVFYDGDIVLGGGTIF